MNIQTFVLLAIFLALGGNHCAQPPQRTITTPSCDQGQLYDSYQNACVSASRTGSEQTVKNRCEDENQNRRFDFAQQACVCIEDYKEFGNSSGPCYAPADVEHCKDLLGQKATPTGTLDNVTCTCPMSAERDSLGNCN